MNSINKNQTQLRALFFGLLCVVAGVMCFAQGFSHGPAGPAVSQSTGERLGVSPPSALIRDAGTVQFTSLTPRYITKRIADIEVGEEVVAKDPDTGDVTKKTVANVFRKVSDHLRILQIRNPLTDELQTIETTDDHPFWVAARSEWIDAKDLKPGDRLDDVDNGTAVVESTNRELHPEGIPVFNFEVEDFHTYYVRAHGSRGPPVLTHNTECPPDGFISLATVEQAARDASKRFDADWIDFYHGTKSPSAAESVRHRINLSKSKKDLDFGERAFYTTQDYSQALRFAGENGDVIHFRMRRSDLERLNARVFSDASTEWQEFVTANRLGQGYRFPNRDVVFGPVLANPFELKSITDSTRARAIGGYDQQAWLSRDAIRMLELVR